MTKHSDNLVLYARLKAGDPAACNELILFNLPIATNAVEAFLRQHPQYEYLSDDLASEANLAIVEGVHRMDELDAVASPNPGVFLTIYALRKLLAFATEQESVTVRQTAYNIRQRGEDVPQIAFGDDYEEEPAASADTEMLLSEIMDLCESEDEQDVISYRAQGYSDAAVAALLGLPETRVRGLRHAVESKFRAA